MNDIFHVRALQRLDERMVWLEPLYFIYFAKNRTWAEGGHFQRETENGVYNPFILRKAD